MKRFLLSTCLTTGLSIGAYSAGLIAPQTVIAEDEGHHGIQQSIGFATIGDYEIELVQEGSIEAGKEATFEIKILKGKPDPKAIRGWIGIESGRGSIKSASHKHEDMHDIHCEVPNPIPEDAKVWIEFETDTGKHKASFAFKRS